MAEQLMSASQSKRKSFLKTILLTGLLAGSLDAIAAMTQFLIRNNGGNPLKVWRYVGSGVLGQDIMNKSLETAAIYGLLFHFLIAFTFTLFFYLIFPTIKQFSKNAFITGLLYGIGVWLVMNLLIVPLSNVNSKGKLWTKVIGADGSSHIAFQFPADPTQMAIGILIIMFCVGLPISLMTHKYYAKQSG
jgi:hypothetical protein